jgi:hypothetical protein
MFNRLLLIALIQVTFLNFSYAEVLFEGYYKVSQFKKHIGFFILRNEIDSKTKEFKTTSFLRLGKNGFNMTESLTAISTTDFKPISYSYLATDGAKSKTIDMTFKADTMSGFVMENGEKSKVSKKLPKGAFLSSSLYYMMLNSKEGLKTGTKFEFTAVAEELADITKVTSTIEKKMVSRGILQLLKANNSFAGMEYENYITNQGQNISALTPATGIETELMKNSEEAVQGIKVSSGTLEKVFGSIPKGKTNVLNN